MEEEGWTGRASWEMMTRGSKCLKGFVDYVTSTTVHFFL